MNLSFCVSTVRGKSCKANPGSVHAYLQDYEAIHLIAPPDNRCVRWVFKHPVVSISAVRPDHTLFDSRSIRSESRGVTHLYNFRTYRSRQRIRSG